jgi:gluconokinase
MGVSGSGKSFLAAKLAQATGWTFAEGDDFHSEANKAKMAAAIPLTDADREPWLESLHQLLAGWESSGANGILTCSALKATYRQTLIGGLKTVHFVWLDPSRAVLQQRMAHRPGHYMPPALLDSQIATLERPTDVVDSTQAALTGASADSAAVLRLDGSQTPEAAVEIILRWLEG